MQPTPEASTGQPAEESTPASAASATKSKTRVAGGALRVPSVATKTTKASQAWVAPAAPAAPVDAPPPVGSAPPAAKPAPTKPVAPTLSTASVARAGTKPATTEEMQLLKAARELAADKTKRDQLSARLDKVLADTGSKLPKRSTEQLTVPKEFNLHASARAASNSRENSTTSEEASPHKPVAEAVKDFTKTPKRFRSKGVTEQPSPPSAPRSLTLTSARSFTLLSDQRAGTRPATKSTAEREEEFMQSMKAFKARPVSQKVMNSVGDLGVPRVKRAEPTLPVEFNLSEARLKRFGGRAKSTRDDDAASDAGSTQSEPTYSFKARPLNRKIMEGAASGLKQATPRKTTRPVSPKLSTTARMRPEVPAEPEPTFAAFKARPMPDHSASPVRSPRKVVARPVTSPKPFSLTSVARHELYEEGRERALEESRQAEQASRNFKARPMPVSEAWKPAVEPKHTTAEPFELKGESRSEVHKAEWEQKAGAQHTLEPTSTIPCRSPSWHIGPLTLSHLTATRWALGFHRQLREQEAAATKERAFKARPPTVLEKAPFEVGAPLLSLRAMSRKTPRNAKPRPGTALGALPS